MWRVPGFVGRVLNRCYGNNALRLSQNHHVDDEVISSSSVLTTSRCSSDGSSQKEGGGKKRKKQRTFHFSHADLPRYTALDAVGWGAAAVLLMHICRRIHSQFSSSPESSVIPCVASKVLKCGSLLEILSRNDVLPRGRSVLCVQRAPERQNRAQSPIQSSSSSSNDVRYHSLTDPPNLSADYNISNHQRAPLRQHSTLPEESVSSYHCPLENKKHHDNAEAQDSNKKQISSHEERLAEATLKLTHTGNTSIPVILNIIGLENAKRENYKAAVTCFLAAAQHGYSKAQFNIGVCYEKGRGIDTDIEKALCYYWQAALNGHRQGQYRYAKVLLTSRRQQSAEELSTAIELLKQAAEAGLTKAQLCLASVYSQDPVRNGCKSVQYLKMAAETGNDTALLFLGQCYESGFGVQQNPRAAFEFYKQATQAGNGQAKLLLTPPSDTKDAVLRSVRSAPCLCDRWHQQHLVLSLSDHIPHSKSHPVTIPLLPHSWSTGSLCPPPEVSSTPLHILPSSTEIGSCQWTVGIG
ncbi:death ligand signal enhancer [Thalassophryne amazonica]|uniref:death ligand signal enhancer n=1 Tax=Thalassophryne amazonica TaxID=390379 RepID=UPI001470C737|nr:death ligand signal enhancer [Thalassophryne amazonica]